MKRLKIGLLHPIAYPNYSIITPRGTYRSTWSIEVFNRIMGARNPIRNDDKH